MGAALARTFAEAGLKTAAWNRTPERAQALAPDGVVPVRDIAELVAGTDLIVACTASYDNMREALAGVEDWDRKTLVGLGTGAPADAAEFEAWASQRGAGYLDGAILCYPQQIGTDEGMVLFAGDTGIWSDHEKVLMTLGQPSTLVSDNVKTASVLDAAIIGGFYTAALGAFVEGATYALDQGVDPGALSAISEVVLQTLTATAREAVDAIAEDRHETDVATLSVYAAGGRHLLAVMREAGFKSRLLAATVENLGEAEEAGLGDLGYYAVSKVARSHS